MGWFPELTLVQRPVHKPLPGAGDITLLLGWMSSSMVSTVGGEDGVIALHGEATVFALAGALNASEARGGLGGSESVSAAFLEGVEGFSFGAHGADGGVDFAELVFILPIARDVSNEPPVPEIDGRVAHKLVVGCTPL